MTITKSFTTADSSLELRIAPGARVAYSVTGAWTAGTIILERLIAQRAAAVQMTDASGAPIQAVNGASLAGVLENPSNEALRMRLRALTTNPVFAGTAIGTLRDVAGHDATALMTGGLPSGTGVVGSEAGSGLVHQTTLVFTNVPLTLRDTQQGQGVKVYTFPLGRIAILGAVGSLAAVTTSDPVATLNAGVTCNWGLGSTTQANGTLATTEQNLLPTTALTASAAINVTGAVSPSQLAAALQLDGTTAAIAAFLNVGIATATDIDGDATVLLNGAVTITWINLGTP